MVAKSYQEFEVLTEPFKENNKLYVNIKYKGKPKRVRWYSQAEYLKMYPEAAHEDTSIQEINYRAALGFANGFITIFSGDTYGSLEYFRTSAARYHRIFGWYFPSTETLPLDLPETVCAHMLTWESITSNDKLVPEAQLTEIVNQLRYPPSTSQFIGTIGQRLILNLTVARRSELQGYYGLSYSHLMRDSDNNEYVWITSAKALDEGATYQLRATIKDHKVYRNSKQTILTRCTII